MNQREKAKQETKLKILRAAGEVFLSQGINRTTTEQLARKCSIAHGTIFVHFKNKDELVCEVFISLLRVSAEQLEDLYDKGSSFENLIDTFFEYIQQNEKMFDIYFCELTHLSVPVKRSVHSFELALRNHFYFTLKREGVNDEDIPAVLNLLFGQLLYYYTFKEVLCGNKKVIETFGPIIKKTLLQYVSKGVVKS